MEDGGESCKSAPAIDEATTYCVTGATGYVGSWLVKALLLKGCKVHATVRNIEKASYLIPKWKNEERLKIFKADLHDEGSFDEALQNCDGVFHVAASMEFNINKDQANVESYVQSNIIDPAIKGTLNLLKSCKRSKSVKRVILTSSISTITAKDSNGNWKPVVDESCQVSVDHVWNTRASGWVYVLSKLLTEEAAFKFANENSLDLVSVITTTVAGPFLTSTLPSSVRVLLSPITNDPELFPILKAVNARMGSIGLVHIEDICNAHIFLMEHPNSKGRYLCCTQNCHLSRLVELLAQSCPCPCPSTTINWSDDGGRVIPSIISSKKLKDLGFEYKHGVETVINQSIKFCKECGYLP
ncbi:putative anthocyanidin reductase [Spinacia oleracea]|uniref:Anthocyanidin reductase n=1 Tax=Spinacia oleracea TaxID=3562 RepID=A0A9R0J8X0_SPIOL|nr:putative anthocyanidin reductase [Spinacia oleracea]